MYAIMNIKTGKFVYGTDYTRHNYKVIDRTYNQRTSLNKMLTYADLEEAESALKMRGCGKDYRIVVLKTIEVERIIKRRRK